MRDYSDLTREQLEARLDAAEDVCCMVGWTASDHSDRGKALHELWRTWLAQVPEDFTSPKAQPHLNNATVRRLAAQRDKTRQQTLARYANVQ